jgi:1-deoxy-D-xylulose-5-phosphate reductoisomerase
MKKLVILGSTGSIGTQALDVARRLPDRFQIVGLAANNNLELLADQANAFGVPNVSVGSEARLGELRDRLRAPDSYTHHRAHET